jgi:hypothetical protein
VNAFFSDYARLIKRLFNQLERAARAFDTGKLVQPSAFNHEYNALFKEYLQSVEKFNHWDELYDKCGISQNCKAPRPRKSTAADLSLVEIGREDLNFSSSPMRE